MENLFEPMKLADSWYKVKISKAFVLIPADPKGTCLYVNMEQKLCSIAPVISLD